MARPQTRRNLHCKPSLGGKDELAREVTTKGSNTYTTTLATLHIPISIQNLSYR